jgi:transcriptional regulator with XRE-family HTH domain
MRSSTAIKQSGSNNAGVLLRRWRETRGKSQLDLSVDAGVSQKHISFVESGRTAPSRQMLLDLAQALDIPLRERNALLIAGGYAPIYSESRLDEPVMKTIDVALRRMLRQHEPFPALVMDRYWDVLFTNEASPRFFNCFIDMSARPRPRNLLHLMFDPDGMRPFLANWSEAERGLLSRIYRESLGHVVDIKTKRLLDELSRYPDVKVKWRAPTPRDDMPMIPLAFSKNGLTLNYFSLITTVGTPQTIAAEELRIECMFPADEATEREHVRFVAENSRDHSSLPH